MPVFGVPGGSGPSDPLQFAPAPAAFAYITPWQGSLPTLLDSNSSLAPASSVITTASVTFVKGQLYQWHVQVDRATAPDFSTGFAFVHGATTRTSDWHYVTQQATGSASRTVALYWNVATVTETVALAFTHPGGTGNSWFYGLVETASGFNSAAPILQSASAQATSGGTAFVGMTASPTPGNLVCCLTGHRGLQGQVSPRSYWTELYDMIGSGAGGAGITGGLEFAYTIDPHLDQATESGGSSSQSWGAITFEIAAGITSTAGLTTAGLSVDSTTAEAFPGTAALTTAGLSVSATVLSFSSTAALTTAGLSVAATSTEVFTGTAALTTAGLSVAATDAEVFTGTAALTTAGLSAAATATETFPSTAALTTAGLSVAATATTFSCTAALTTAGLSAAATATESFPSTAALTTAGLSVAATAVESLPSTAALTTAGLSADATVTEVFTGTAALTTAGLSSSATASEVLTGTVAATTAGLSAGVTASTFLDSTASLTTAGLSVAATDAEIFTSTADLTTAGLSVAASANRTSDSADVACTVAGLSVDASVAEAFEATAAATLAGLSWEAEAFVANPVALTVECTVAGLACEASAFTPEIHLPTPEPPRTIQVPLEDFVASQNRGKGLSGWNKRPWSGGLSG